jgi:hypothetical protein
MVQAEANHQLLLEVDVEVMEVVGVVVMEPKKGHERPFQPNNWLD